MTVKGIKSQLLEFCEHIVQQRFEKIKTAISLVEESLFEESKSTSGDKHHTGRAMLQIEREKLGKQLHEIEQLQSVLKRIDLTPSAAVSLGSLVTTSTGNYFISISAGKVQLQGVDYYCISMSAPIAKAIKGKQVGEEYQFHGRLLNILSVQ